MTSVLDVAAYILAREGQMTAMKLQKLCYYSQAWSLVWDEKALFSERIEAWANGPVAPTLYAKHRGNFTLGPGAIPGNSEALTAEQRDSVNVVLDFYGKKSAHELSDLTHREAPWRDAREGVPPGERCDNEITVEAMYEYYDGLYKDDPESSR
jgi:uncharacterized phage-associated protein